MIHKSFTTKQSIFADLAFSPSLPLRQIYSPCLRPISPSSSRRYSVFARTVLPPKPIEPKRSEKTASISKFISTKLPLEPSDVSFLPQHDQPSSSSFLDFFWPRALLLGIAAVWGTNFGTVKFLQTGPSAISTSTAAVARFSLAAIVMLPFVFVEIFRESKKQSSRKSKLPTFPTGFLSTTFGIGLALFLGYFTQSVSLDGTEANKSAFICSLTVVVVPVVQWILQLIGIKDVNNRDEDKKSHPVVAWGSPLLAVLGVAMLELSSQTAPCAGDLWALGQPIGFALGFILNQRATARFPNLIFSISAMQLIVTAALSELWAVIDTSLSNHALSFPHISDAFTTSQNSMAVVYAGLITTALTIWLENIALVKVSAGELAILLSTEPFWAAAFSSVILSEQMGTQAVAGGIVILIACLLNQSKHINIGKSWKNIAGPLGVSSIALHPWKMILDHFDQIST